MFSNLYGDDCTVFKEHAVLNIRDMTLTCLDSIVAIEKRAHISPWSRDIIRDCMMLRYDCWVLDDVVDSNRKTLGYLISRECDDIAHLLNFCIDTPFQHQHYGTHFLKHYLKSMQQRGLLAVELEVRPSNVVAQALYLHAGFVQIGVKKDYYKEQGQHNEHALVYRLDLKANA